MLKHLVTLMRQVQPSDKGCVRLIRQVSDHIVARSTQDAHGSATLSVKQDDHERTIFKQPKFSTSLLIGIGLGLLVSPAAAWCCGRLQRFSDTRRSPALRPVEDLRRAAGMVC